MQRIKIYAFYAREEKRQFDEIDDIKFNESIHLPTDFDYNKISLSLQAKEILFKYKPTTLGAATRIPGVTPATIHTLLVYFKKEKLFKPYKKVVNL
jgi:tRNA uridine 5-carboxymethylaminomethyl modification enzyme